MTTTSLAKSNPYHCPLGSLVADGVDYLGLLCPSYKDAKDSREKASRVLSYALSLGVFPWALGLDMIYLKAFGFYERMRAYLARTPEENTDRHEQAQNCNELFFKCLRGFIATPQSLFGADIVTIHFLEPERTHDIIRPYGKLYASHAQRVCPTSEQEVVMYVNLARSQSRKISIKGAGYAQGKQTLPPADHDLCIDLHKFKKIEIDTQSKVAVVGAGVRWGNLQAEADKHGLAILVQQASNVFSIGGSIGGANCHGWDFRWGSIGNTVQWMKIVRSNGQVETVKQGDELFNLALGGYGLFGIILEVGLQLTDNSKLLCWGEKVDINKYVEYYKTKIQPRSEHHMHLFRLSISPKGILSDGSVGLLSEGYAQNYTLHDSEAHTTENLVNEAPEGSLKDRIMLQCARHFPFLVDWWWKRERQDILTHKTAMRNEIMRPPIEAAFNNHSVSCAEWLQEYFLPGEHLADFIHYLGKVLTKNEVKLLNCSVRPVIQDKYSVMGYAKDGERFAVVLFFTQYLQEDHVNKTRQWVRDVVDKVIEMKGTFYLPYMHFATRDQFRKCYPQYELILKKKEEYDCDSIFENGLYVEYIR